MKINTDNGQLIEGGPDAVQRFVENRIQSKVESSLLSYTEAAKEQATEEEPLIMPTLNYNQGDNELPAKSRSHDEEEALVMPTLNYEKEQSVESDGDAPLTMPPTY